MLGKLDAFASYAMPPVGAALRHLRLRLRACCWRVRSLAGVRARSVETAGGAQKRNTWRKEKERFHDRLNQNFEGEKTHLRTAKGLARLHTILLILPFHRQRKGDKKVLTGY